jgi:hypothetical protein
MPNKWHICKEGQASTKKDNSLGFLNYLAFLRPAANRAVSILPWVVSPGRSYGFLWAGSIIQKNVRKEELHQTVTSKSAGVGKPFLTQLNNRIGYCQI